MLVLLICTLAQQLLQLNIQTLFDNHAPSVSEMEITIRSSIIQTGKYSTEADVTFSMLNSTVHTKSHSDYGVRIVGCCASVQINNTSMRFANTVHRLFT